MISSLVEKYLSVGSLIHEIVLCLKNCHIILIFMSNIKTSSTPHTWQYMVLAVLKFIHSSMYVVVSHCGFFFFISLMTNDAEHLYVWLFATCISFVGMYLYKYFVHFYWVGYLLTSRFQNPSYMITFISKNVIPLSHMHFVNIVSYSVAWLFGVSFFSKSKDVNLDKVQFIYFFINGL